MPLGGGKVDMLKQLTSTFVFACVAAWAADSPAGVPKGAKETAPGVYRHVDPDGKAWIYRKTPFGVSKRAAEETETAPAAGSRSGEATHRTPFGETRSKSRYEDVIEHTATTRQSEAGRNPVQTKVTEDGETLHFERPSPFGAYKWSRKKDDLTADEKRLWESQRTSSAGASGK